MSEAVTGALKDLACRAIDRREDARSAQVTIEAGGFQCAVWWEDKQLCIAIVRPAREGAGV